MLLFILQPDVFFEFCIFTVTVTIQYFREAVYRIVTDSYKLITYIKERNL